MTSLAYQAMAVWVVDAKGIVQKDCGGMTLHEFHAALRNARVTLNVVAATPEIRTLVERELKQLKKKGAA
jgi:hypothetical protein